MDCPHCTETMHPTVVGSVELDICSACGTVFFDAGELRRHLRAGRRLEEELNHAATKWGKPTESTCPKCSGTFAVVATLAGRVEVCDGCDGAMLSVDVFQAAPRRGVLPVKPGAPGIDSAGPFSGGALADTAGDFGGELAGAVAIEAAGGLLELLFEALGEILGGL